MTLALTLFLAGADSAPSFLPRGFSIIVLSCLTQGLELFDFFRVLSQHFSIVPAGALLGPYNFSDGGLG